MVKESNVDNSTYFMEKLLKLPRWVLRLVMRVLKISSTTSAAATIPMIRQGMFSSPSGVLNRDSAPPGITP